MKTAKNIIAQIPLLANHPYLSINKLSCGQSNQSFLISIPDNKYVLRLDTEAQDIFNCCREYELEILGILSEKKLSPEPIYSDIDKGVLLYTFIEGTPLTQELILEPLVKQQFIELRQKISDIGKQLKTAPPTQALLGEIILEKDLPEYNQLSYYHTALSSIGRQLEQLSDEYCLCHNDLSPSNLLLDSSSKLFGLDWEYASNSHPLLDFAFFANNFDLSDEVVKKHFYESIKHNQINFIELRRLAFFIEAVWYAKRHLYNPSEQWKSLLNQALSKL